jgi:hypothetical protein
LIKALKLDLIFIIKKHEEPVAIFSVVAGSKNCSWNVIFGILFDLKAF